MDIVAEFLKSLKSGRYRQNNGRVHRSDDNTFSATGVLLDTFDRTRWVQRYWGKNFGIPAITKQNNWPRGTEALTYYIPKGQSHKQWCYDGEWPLRIPFDLQSILPEPFTVVGRAVFFDGLSIDECEMTFAEIAEHITEVLLCLERNANCVEHESARKKRNATDPTATTVTQSSSTWTKSNTFAPMTINRSTPMLIPCSQYLQEFKGYVPNEYVAQSVARSVYYRNEGQLIGYMRSGFMNHDTVVVDNIFDLVINT